MQKDDQSAKRQPKIGNNPGWRRAHIGIAGNTRPFKAVSLGQACSSV